MSDLAIHLLGRPRVRCGGDPVPAPRGHKAWGVLAYLLLTERAPSRAELAGLLFADADDPLAALRWNLSALRRTLGAAAELTGDPVRLTLPPDTFVDVTTVAAVAWSAAIAVPELERELLEGAAFPACPSFEIWLVTERRRLAAAAEAVLHEGALARLARSDPRGAAELAARLVRANPLDENHQALLVRSLSTAGQTDEATRQLQRGTELLRRELGVEPSPALAQAARSSDGGHGTTGPVGGRMAAQAQLDAGEAAIGAGALDAGLECLRRAVADARALGDPALGARALLALGGALVHAARGRDEEASAALHEALATALSSDQTATAAAASRELGYVEFLQGRYDRADHWLRGAETLAAGDPGELGRIGSVAGSACTDTAHYRRALTRLAIAREQSEAAGDARRVAYTLSMVGRARLLRGELDDAAAALDESLQIVEQERWIAFTPWPEALRGDVDLARGDVDRAADRYEHAFALGCQLTDPCWEGIAARGLGLVAAQRGQTPAALDWLVDARRRGARLPDAYRWVEAYTLDALCAIAVAGDAPAAPAWVAELTRMAARCGMRELSARAYAHRAGLGDASAGAAAVLLAESIDNPALAETLAASAHTR